MITLLKKVQWFTLPFLLLTVFIAFGGLAFYIPRYGVHPLEPIVCAVYVFIIAMVVSGGYHRYFAHKTFQCHPILKVFYLIVGAAAFQQSALVWASDHRFHHRYVDTDKDPYNIKKGFWWAHIGWQLAKDPESRSTLLDNVPDLAKDKWVMRQHKYWIWVSIPLAFGIPLLIGLLIGRPMGMLLWAGILRIVITHHTTFTINSVAHKFGAQPYSDENSARDVWWLAPLLCGEHNHNYHHRFQGDYRNGVRWHHYDPTKWALWLLSHTPLVKQPHRTPPHLILKARLEMDLKRLEQKLKTAPREFWIPLKTRLIGMRKMLEETAELS
ncbi:MAG: acyl-CoA desaturase [Deltaproteobacteria bacterium]|nr:acyl-CoA desaturase [Deltaproteobacteria bacterium]